MILSWNHHFISTNAVGMETLSHMNNEMSYLIVAKQILGKVTKCRCCFL